MAEKLGLNISSTDKLQRMANMTRFNNEIHLHSESVAEHSFFVAVYALMICDELKISRKTTNVIVKRALVHDISEIEISDIPHNVKLMIDGLNDACNKYEEDFIKENFERVHKDIEALEEDQRELCENVVKLEDILSVIQYSRLEVDMGNKRFGPILDDAIQRYVETARKLGDENSKLVAGFAK